MFSEVEIGQAITLLFDNHRKNHFTLKSSLKPLIKAPTAINEFLTSINNQLACYNMALVGFKDNCIVLYKESLNLTITRKKHSNIVTDHFKFLTLVLSVLYLEGENISKSKFVNLMVNHVNEEKINGLK